ncbi:MAG: hypothetical protein WAQ17_04655 [Limnochordia bacterium]
MKKCVLVLVAFLLVTTAAWAQSDPDLLAAYLSRVEIQMNRLTALINLGSVPEIRLLLSHELTEAGLAEYLANLPPDLGEIWVETMEVTGSELGSPFAVVFRTESGARFSALLGWQEESGQLKLTGFLLTPYQQWVSGELRQSLEDLVHELKEAVHLQQYERFLTLLGDGANSDQAWGFFRSLNPHSPWYLTYVALEPVSLTIAVPQSPQLKLLVNLELIAGETSWLIETVEAIPLW